MAKKENPVQRIVSLVSVALVAGAVVQQLRRPKEDRTWQGRIARVPYDLRRPTLSRVKERLWNPNDRRLFTPQVFGVGWTVNLHRLLGLVRRKPATSEPAE